MKSEKRGRGRPKGSPRHNAQDRRTLEYVAEMMVRDSKLSPTTAMRQLGHNDDSSLHPLQRKWLKLGSELLDQAKRDYRQELSVARGRRVGNALEQFISDMTLVQRAFGKSGLELLLGTTEGMKHLFAPRFILDSLSCRIQMQEVQMAKSLAQLNSVIKPGLNFYFLSRAAADRLKLLR